MAKFLPSWGSVTRAVTAVYDFTKDINPATLSGAIDVVVVQDQDGNLACSPFHVRFGKLKLLLPSEKAAEVIVNGKPTGLFMKLGEAGEAFFVVETENPVPSEYATSPIASAEPSGDTPPPMMLDNTNSRGEYREDATGYESARASDIDDSEYQPDPTPNPEPEDVDLKEPTALVPEHPFSDGEMDKTPLRRSNSNKMPLSDTELEYSAMSKMSISNGSIVQPRGGSRSFALAEPSSPTSPTQDKWSWSWGGLPQHQEDPSSPTSPTSPGSPFESNTTPLINLNHPLFGTQVASDPATPVDSVTLDMESSRDTSWPMVELSLCGEASTLARLPPLEADATFQSSMVTFEKFCENPGMLNEPNLVVRLNGEYFSWHVAGPLLVSMMAFGKRMPEDVTASILNRKSASSWRSWWSSSKSTTNAVKSSRNVSPNATSPPSPGRFLHPEIQESIKYASSNASDTNSVHASRDASPKRMHTNYAKTLRLTSDQLKSLDLKPGLNNVTFTVRTSGLQGNASTAARIWLFDRSTKIIVSDVDGTITRSDTLGHIFTMVGKDWTHSGVAGLYTAIVRNGYQMLYLTSRAIGQASYTRDYLKKVEQGKFQLPDGPVIMSPDRLFKALHREVIIRRPEEFKMSVLRDIKRLFGDANPFFAGFGNRITDGLSYRSVGIPPSRIFTIDPAGDVKLELLPSYKSSYSSLNELVDHLFPPTQTASNIASSEATPNENYTDFNYWRSPLPEVDVKVVIEPTTKTYDDDAIVESEDDEGYRGGGEEDLAAYANGV